MKKHKYTKFFKKCVTSLACREMKTETTFRFTFTPVTIVSLSKQMKTDTGENVVKTDPLLVKG